MAPRPEQVFYIVSRATDTDQTFVLGVDGDGSRPGTAVTLGPLDPTVAQSQLWNMTADGRIVSRFNGMALAGNEQRQVVMQTATDQPSHSWKANGDGRIACPGADLVLALAGGARSGQELLMAPEDGQDVEGLQRWTLASPPAPPAPSTAIPPQWVYLRSALTQADGSACLLNVQGGSTTPGTEAIVWRVLSQVGPNELWQIMPDGRIVSALDSSLVLTLGPPNDGEGGGYFVTVDTPQDPLPLTQVWDLSTVPNGIRNSFSGQCLVPQGGTSGPITLDGNSVLAASGTWSASYEWTVSPVTRPRWVFFESALTQADGSAGVLNVRGGSTTPGSDVIVWPITPQFGCPNELWMRTLDGRILSGQSNDLVLTAGPTSGDGNQVTVDSQQDPLPQTQLWDPFTAPPQIRNRSTGEYLVPQGGTSGPIVLDGNNVLTAPGTSNPSYMWYEVPSSSLATLMAQPAVPFPTFSGGQAAAYACINGRLSITSLRAEYYNLTVTLADYGARIASWAQPPDGQGISQADWDAVRDQLLVEITYADATRNLFANYGTFHMELFEDDGFLLDKLISDAGMTVDGGSIVQGMIIAAMDGLTYAGLSAMGGEFAVAANLMQVGVGVGEAVGSSGAISPNPFQVTVSELWNQLSTSFEALLDGMGVLENAILQDWGKLQSVYAMTQQQSGGDSLYWDPNTTGRLVRAARIGYTRSALQMLLPVKYQIYRWKGLQDLPESIMWQTGGNTYYIAEIANYDAYPTEDMMDQDVWSTGVSKSDFFRDSADWGFLTSTEIGNVWFVLTFCNQTPNLLRLTGSTFDFSLDVDPFQRVSMNFEEALGSPFSVTDQNNNGNEVAQFKVEQLEDNFYITSTSAVSGYCLSQPLGTQGFVRCPPAGQITLSLG